MRTPAKTSLIAAVLLVSAVVAGSLFSGPHSHQYGLLGRRWRTPSPRLCRSEPCRRLATLISDAVNRSARPCVNFHDYVCGGWLQSRSVSVARALRGSLIDKVTREARKDQVPDLHQTPSEKAARYFTACDDVVSASEDHLDEVKALLRRGGIRWPDMDAKADLLEAIFYMSRVVRVPIVFELSFDRSSSQNKVFVFNTMRMLDIMTSRNRQTKKSTAKNFFRTLYEAFSSETVSDVERRFASLAEQQSELFALLNASLNSMTQKATTTSEVHHWTRTVSKKRWQAVFYKYFNIAKNSSLPVVLDSKSYFMAFFAHYRKSGPVQTMDLYGYLCAEALFSFTSHKIIASYYGSQRVSSQHREHCFYQTDYFMHYAFMHSLFNNVSTESVRDDVTRLVARLVRAVDNTLNTGWSFFGDCPAYANDKERLLDVFRKYEPRYVKEAYSSYPDMSNNPLANWIWTVEVASALYAEEIPVGELMFGHEARVAESPVDLAFLEVLWYTLGAPHAVKLAGLGSQVTRMVFHDILSSKKPCQRLMKSTEKLWKCIMAGEPDSKHFRAIKEDVLVSLLSESVLWPVFKNSLTGGSRVLAELGSLSEPELFFVLTCLPLCGGENAEPMCNLPLKHSLEFSRVFSCRRGAHMRPKFQCSTTALRPRPVGWQ
ncbi:endothelin-converting enzyme 2-like isoform X2 [Dermacentor albipictus]